MLFRTIKLKPDDYAEVAKESKIHCLHGQTFEECFAEVIDEREHNYFISEKMLRRASDGTLWLVKLYWRYVGPGGLHVLEYIKNNMQMESVSR